MATSMANHVSQSTYSVHSCHDCPITLPQVVLVVTDLLEETTKLREEKHALEFVEITGPGRQPVYARGHLRDDGYASTVETDTWVVKMNQLTPCPLQDLNDIEVWMKNCFVSLDKYVRGSVLAHETLRLYVVSPCPDRASSGLKVVVADFPWDHQELETYARDLPSLQRLLDGVQQISDEQYRLATHDLLQIDHTAVCTFYSVQLYRDLIGLD